jgi:hypothetical protein
MSHKSYPRTKWLQFFPGFAACFLLVSKDETEAQKKEI